MILNVIFGLPLCFFFFWRFVAAWQSYREGIADPQNSPVNYLASNGIVLCVLAPVLAWFTQPWSLILHGFCAVMFCLGLWHLYWWYRFRQFRKAKGSNAAI